MCKQHNTGSQQAHVLLASFLQTPPSLLSKRARQKGNNVMTIITQTESPSSLLEGTKWRISPIKIQVSNTLWNGGGELLELGVVVSSLSRAQLFCDSMDCSPPPGSSVCGISQAIILEWVAISSSRGYSWPRDGTHVSCIGMQILYCWATREAHTNTIQLFKIICKSSLTC